MALETKIIDDGGIGTVPGGSSAAKDTKSTEVKVNQSANDVTNLGNYSFLYNDKLSGVIKDIRQDKLLVTRLSNLNNYYFTVGTNYNSQATPISGKSSAVNRYSYNWSQAKRVSNPSSWGSEKDNYKKFNNGTVIANCVGWVNGRMWEIWERAISTGYIKWDASQNSYVTKNGAKIKGNFNYPNYPPACDAVSFYDYWPTSEGWEKSSKPQVGAVVCWGYGSLTGHPGHVAVVEEIIDRDTPNEALIISHSSAAPSGSMWLVKLSKIWTKKNYYVYDDHPFRSFLISPICQLASTNAKGTVSTIPQEATAEQKEEIRFRQELMANKNVEVDLPANAKVKVVRLGYKKPEGSTKISDRINNIGSTAVIWTKNNSKNYPYGICFDDDESHQIQGYYDWTGLEVISSGTLTDETIRIHWDDEGHESSRPTELQLTLNYTITDLSGKNSGNTRTVILDDSNNWSVKVAGIEKYSPTGATTKVEWILDSRLPTHYKEEKNLRTRLNRNTSITLKYYV